MRSVQSRVVAGAAAVALLFGSAACASSSDNDAKEAGDFTKQPSIATSPPAAVAQDVPLPEAPEPGKTVGFIGTSTPLQTYYAKEFTAAAATLDWDVKVYTYTDDPSGAMAQAIGAGVDYIYLQSVDKASVKAQLQAAKDADIPVVNSGTTDESDPDNLYYTIARSGEREVTGLGNWIMNDSKGTANVLYVTMLVFPYFQGNEEVLSKRFADGCPSCTYNVLDVTPAEFGGGQVPAKIVNYLQSNPDVDYLYLQFDDLYLNVYPTLKAAGLADRVKIVVGAGGKTTLTGLSKGEVAIASQYANQASPWAVLDLIARISEDVVDDKLLQSDALEYSTADIWALVDNDEARAEAAKLAKLDYGWPGPDGFQEQFKKLWNVS